eukprot:7359812-Ditylum_brightwellii.AAC.1
MQRNIRYGKDNTVKEWVDCVRELNRYLKDFPAYNGNPTQPLNADELLDILEFRVPSSWRREFTAQGFDPADQSLCKFVEFCTRLESCEPREVEIKGENPTKSKYTGKRKAKVSTLPTALTKDLKFYCEMHKDN